MVKVQFVLSISKEQKLNKASFLWKIGFLRFWAEWQLFLRKILATSLKEEGNPHFR